MSFSVIKITSRPFCGHLFPSALLRHYNTRGESFMATKAGAVTNQRRCLLTQSSTVQTRGDQDRLQATELHFTGQLR